MVYLIFKWIHVLSAIAALGANITYGVWLGAAARNPQSLGFTLQTIKEIDNRLANRAYGLLLVTGVIMFFLGRWALNTSWLIIALILYLVVGVVGFAGFTPNLRKQINIAETAGPSSAEYRASAQRTTTFGVATIVLVAIIVFLMVAKPHIWG